MGIDDGIICGFFCHPDELVGSRFGQLYSTRCVLVCLSLLVEVVDGLYGKVGETVPDPTLTSPETVKPQPTPPSTLGFEILSLTFSRRHNYICMPLVSKSFSVSFHLISINRLQKPSKCQTLTTQLESNIIISPLLRSSAGLRSLSKSPIIRSTLPVKRQH